MILPNQQTNQSLHCYYHYQNLHPNPHQIPILDHYYQNHWLIQTVVREAIQPKNRLNHSQFPCKINSKKKYFSL